MKKKLLPLIFICLCIFFFSCTQNRGTKKEAIVLINDSVPTLPKDIVALVDTLNRGDIADTDTALAMKWVNEYLAKFSLEKDPYAYHVLIQEKAHNYFIQKNYDSVIKYASIGLAYFEKQPFYTQWLFINHYRLVMAYYRTNQHPLAVLHNSKAKLAAQDPQIYKYMLPDAMVSCLTDLAMINRATMYYNDAIANIRTALILSKQLPDEKKYLTGFTLVEMVSIYREMGNEDSSTFYLQRAKESIAKYYDKNVEKKYLTTLGEQYFAQSKNDSAIIAMKQFLRLKQTEEPGFQFSGFKLLMWGKANFYNGNLAEAKKSFTAYMDAMKTNPEDFDLRDSSVLYEVLPAYYMAVHDNKKAAEAFEAYLAMEPRRVDETHMETIRDMEARYQLKEKEKSITDLRLNTLEYQLSIRKKNQLLQIVIGSLIIVLLLGVGLFLFQRQKTLKETTAKLQVQNRQLLTEQKVLQIQLNPHFIYNCIANLQGLISMGKNEQANKYLTTFSRVLRNMLELNREDLITIADEISSLNNYLQLQQLRFENVFDYEIEIPKTDNVESIKIPPMLLQPFIENAIEHGFKGIDYKGKIIISFEPGINTLNISIKDNGIGIQSAAHRSNNKKSLATTITQERLNVLFNKDVQKARLETMPQEKGYAVNIFIPLITD